MLDGEWVEPWNEEEWMTGLWNPTFNVTLSAGMHYVEMIGLAKDVTTE
jgi:hypothetical protein